MEQGLKKRKCLVVGSAHVDLFADITGETDVIDRRGDLQVGVGGTAFNVTVNLMSLGMDVTLISVLKKRSLFTRIILSKLEDLALTREGIILSSTVGEAGFIAHRHKGELIKAVSSTPIETITIDAAHYQELAQNAEFIVVDLNNSHKTAANFLTLDKPVYIMGVSEPKILKLLALRNASLEHIDRVKGIFLNRHEAHSILHEVKGNKAAYEDLSAIINTLWIVTRDKDGVVLIKDGKRLLDMPALKANNVSSFSGAGDAFAAGFLHAKLDADMSIAACVERALLFTTKTLARIHANNIEDSILNNVDKVIYRDSMTLLYNRKFYDEEKAHIEYSLRRRVDDTLAVAIFDIDDFKSVNDAYGHDMGDEIIRSLAKVIRDNVREHDLPIRFGGEEFVILFHSCTLETAIGITERIRKAFQKVIVRFNGTALSKTLSAGVALYDRSSKDLDQVVKAADEALYRAKKSGKNCIIPSVS